MFFKENQLQFLGGKSSNCFRSRWIQRARSASTPEQRTPSPEQRTPSPEHRSASEKEEERTRIHSRLVQGRSDQETPIWKQNRLTISSWRINCIINKWLIKLSKLDPCKSYKVILWMFHLQMAFQVRSLVERCCTLTWSATGRTSTMASSPSQEASTAFVASAALPASHTFQSGLTSLLRPRLMLSFS